MRLALIIALTAVVAGVGATTAHALAFSEAICPGEGTTEADPKTCPSGLVGAGYSVQLSGRSGCWPEDGASPENMVSFSASGLPPGLTLSSSGLFSGTATQAGTWMFWVTMRDHAGVSWCTDDKHTERIFRIAINPGLRIVTNSIPQGATVGAPYSATLDAQLVTSVNPPSGSTPAPGSLTWSIASGTLPPGLALANGVLSGTPTTEGSYTFQVQAALDASRKHAQTYAMTVRQPLKVTPAKPLATPPLSTAWEAGVAFSAKLTPSGGSGTYTFALGTGTLPTGLVLGPDGTLSGTPSTAGVFRATVKVSDSEGRTADYAANFGVAARLAVSTLALRPGKVGRLYRAKVSSSGGVLPRKWRIAKGPLPKGIRFDRDLGVLSGTPTRAGRYRVTFQVTDGLRVVAKKTLRIDVLDA